MTFQDIKEEVTIVTGKQSEEHTSELQSLREISYAVFCLVSLDGTFFLISVSSCISAFFVTSANTLATEYFSFEFRTLLVDFQHILGYIVDCLAVDIVSYVGISVTPCVYILLAAPYYTVHVYAVVVFTFLGNYPVLDGLPCSFAYQFQPVSYRITAHIILLFIGRLYSCIHGLARLFIHIFIECQSQE